MVASQTEIKVVGAAEHNLQNIDVAFSRGQVTVVTGVSGSGKSSLAFDTVLAEAQRRFFYTLSHYSRQFLDLQSRPAVSNLTGLSPAIALAQNETQPSPRATVGTLTDLSELLGVMLARFGERFCPDHDLPTASSDPAAVVSRILSDYAGKNVAVCAPVAEQKKGIFRKQLESFAQQGYMRAYIDGQVLPLSPTPQLAREEKHTIKVIVDLVKVKEGGDARLLRSVKTALEIGQGHGEFFVAPKKDELDLAQGGRFAATGGCPTCGFSWPALDSRYFSANSLGRCTECDGLGHVPEDEVEDDGFAMRTGQLPPCGECGGTGLNDEVEGVKLGGLHARQLHSMSLGDLRRFLRELAAGAASNPAFARVHFEMQAILDRIHEIGLDYLMLYRRVRSLSGGESQRLKLAGILGENFRGVLYVLDEPSQGLHPSELEGLWQALVRLRDAGNTLIIVDHDEFFMRRADWLIDLGPGGGRRGGRLMAKFKPDQAASFAEQSVTAAHLVRQAETHSSPRAKARNSSSARLKINSATTHNLKNVTATIPVGQLTTITGVSGAGKSSLLLGTLFTNILNQIEAENSGRQRAWHGCKSIAGLEQITTVEMIDRRPLAKSSVSMPATYLDVFTPMRNMYAKLSEAQIAGLTARSFSLAAEGGRCPECKGRGEVAMSMRFLADARVRCPVCRGARYRPHVLDVRYKGLSLAEVLELTLDETVAHFIHHKVIVRRLQPALDLGLGYLKLGQPSSSLSGGEAQRLKLVPYLGKAHVEGSLLIMDEPTTGLHFDDVQRLLKVVDRLVTDEVTVVMIEHNADVICHADHVIDLGPGAAAAGGRILYQGPPAGLADAEESLTGRYLCQKN